jgi:hypothetical protein
LSPDREFSLGALGRKHTLTRHTPETFSRHSQANKALALIPEAQRSRVTHFVEEVELPADAVGIHLVTYPNKDPNSIPELALAFIHIPIAAKRRHFRQKRKDSERKPHATSLTHFGISLDSHSQEEAAAVRLDATQVVTPFSAAEAIIFNHPDLLTTRTNVASTVIYDHIGQTLQQDGTLPQYLSTHGPGSSDPYYAIHTATNPQTGAPIISMFGEIALGLIFSPGLQSTGVGFWGAMEQKSSIRRSVFLTHSLFSYSGRPLLSVT